MVSTVLFSATARFCDIKQQRKLLIFVFLFDSNNKLKNLILLQIAHVVLMTFLVRFKSYMELSRETSDKITPDDDQMQGDNNHDNYVA